MNAERPNPQKKTRRLMLLSLCSTLVLTGTTSACESDYSHIAPKYQVMSAAWAGGCYFVGPKQIEGDEVTPIEQRCTVAIHLRNDGGNEWNLFASPEIGYQSSKGGAHRLTFCKHLDSQALKILHGTDTELQCEIETSYGDRIDTHIPPTAQIQ
jgi:hypothetical protein